MACHLLATSCSIAMAPSTSKESGSVAKRTVTQTLHELNPSFARHGVFDLAVWLPKIHTYQYIAKKSGNTMQGADFRCFMVDPSDRTMYVVAHLAMRNDNMGPLTNAEKKFEAGAKFRCSQVSLDSNVKQEYMHAPVKVRINLATTKSEKVVGLPTGETYQPEPAMTIAYCKQLTSSCRFDVTAIIDEVSEPRPIAHDRQVVSVTLIDDSADQGAPAELSFSLWQDLPLSKDDCATFDTLRKAAEAKQCLSLFALQGKHSNKGFSFEADSKKEFFVFPAVGKRADALAEVAEELLKIPKDKRDVLEQATYEARDYEHEPGQQTMCKLLQDLANTTDVHGLNEKPTLWNANWVEVERPQGENLLKKDGSSLWFQVSLRDLSGQVTGVWMNEKSALSLSGLENKDEFIESLSSGNQVFPVMSAVKVIRESRTTSSENGSSTQASKMNVNLVVVSAIAQPFDEAPSNSALEMIPLMKDHKDDTSAILPAALDMVDTSKHYALTVRLKAHDGSTIQLPCQKVIALVFSSQKCETSQTETGSYYITTKGIEDALAAEDTSEVIEKKTFTLSAMCTLSNLTQYRLDGTKKQKQAAIVILAAKTPDAFIVESMQCLQPNEVSAVRESLQRLQFFAMHMYMRDRKRTVEWNDECSPAKSKKCRTMGRSPSDIPLPIADSVINSSHHAASQVSGDGTQPGM